MIGRKITWDKVQGIAKTYTEIMTILFKFTLNLKARKWSVCVCVCVAGKFVFDRFYNFRSLGIQSHFYILTAAI